MWNLGVLKLIVVIFDLKLDGPNLNNLEFEGLCRSEGFRMAPMEEHASILSECQWDPAASRRSWMNCSPERIGNWAFESIRDHGDPIDSKMLAK